MNSSEGSPIRPQVSRKEDVMPAGIEVEVEAQAGDGAQEGQDAGEQPGDEGAGEGLRPRAIASPSTPTRQEIEEHELTHLPFRSWCRHCVRGRAKGDPHAQHQEDEHAMPMVCCDYCFMGDSETDRSTPILAVTDNKYKSAFAHVCIRKGTAHKWIVNQVKRDIDLMGYTDIVFKSDGEPSIVQLKREVGELRGPHRTVPEEAPVGDHQANGRVESKIAEIEGYIRTIKDNIEYKANISIHSNSPLLAWIAEYTGTMLTCYSIGKDGRTAYQRMKGCRRTRPIACFGENIWYKKAVTNHLNKLECRWEPGIWLNVDMHTNEVIIGTSRGVVKAKSVRRRPLAERFDAEALNTMKGLPWEPVPGVDSEEIPIDIPIGEPRVEGPLPPVPPAPVRRSVYIRQADILKYGMTPACPGCAAIRAKNKRAINHNAECRERIEKLMEEDLGERERLVEARKRKAQDINEDVEVDEGMQVEGEAQVDGDAFREFLRRRVERGDAAQASSTQASASSSAPPAASASSSAVPQAVAPSTPVRLPESDSMHTDSVEHHWNTYQINSTDKFESELDHRIIRKLLMGIDVGEIYSPARVNDAANRLGLQSGWSLDLRTTDDAGVPWDFNKAAIRAKAIDLINKTKPLFIIGSPPCTMFSQLQRLNKNMGSPEWNKLFREACEHLKFSVSVYFKQLKEGRYFLHEHPAGATSWEVQCIRDLLRAPSVHTVDADLCAFGLSSSDEVGAGLVRKTTTFVSNSPELARRLGRRCMNRVVPHSHRHVRLTNGRAQAAQEYTAELCRTICQGIIAQKAADASAMTEVGSVSLSSDDFKLSEEMFDNECCEELDEAWDDVTGKELDPELVRKARAKEIAYFRAMGVYRKVPISEAYKWTSKAPIGTRWVDVNKGDSDNPDYRSRLVAKEINRGANPELFAATPPIESLKLLISMAASKQKQGKDLKLMFNDVSRAYFYAKSRRKIFVQLPDEDKEPEDEGMCGELLLSMYGTRDAAQNWEAEYSSFLISIGFEQGVASPCHFFHRDRGIQTVVHGDDFSSLAADHELMWMKSKLEAKYQIKTKVLGPDERDYKQVRVLNRVISWENGGITYEADPRHAELVIKQMKVEEANPVTSPGCKPSSGHAAQGGSTDDEVALEAEERTAYRALAARCNFLAIDRPDIQFAAKEISRHMSNPRRSDWNAVKRIARFLKGKPRLVHYFRWQDEPADFSVYTDADWAGCTETRRSTSGGVVMHGAHVIKTWSRTQPTIALSSGESEMIAIVKASSEAMGCISIGKDLGLVRSARVLTDASAAFGMVHRKGLGKVRHLETRHLWVQEAAARKALEYKKVGTNFNIADAMTKFMEAWRMESHMNSMGLRYFSGRPDAAPQL